MRQYFAIRVDRRGRIYGAGGFAKFWEAELKNEDFG